MRDLLDPTNDYVFKRLFVEAPELLVALINDLRPDLPDIASVEILNPNIEPSDLTGKYIILDVLARDTEGHCYNVEVQVRRYGVWHKRGLFYLARTLGGQLGAGEDYQELRASVGLHLLDFDLFTATEGERQQAVWRFEMRDERQPARVAGEHPADEPDRTQQGRPPRSVTRPTARLDHFLQTLAGGTHHGHCHPRTGQASDEPYPRAQCR